MRRAVAVFAMLGVLLSNGCLMNSKNTTKAAADLTSFASNPLVSSLTSGLGLNATQRAATHVGRRDEQGLDAGRGIDRDQTRDLIRNDDAPHRVHRHAIGVNEQAAAADARGVECGRVEPPHRRGWRWVEIGVRHHQVAGMKGHRVRAGRDPSQEQSGAEDPEWPLHAHDDTAAGRGRAGNSPGPKRAGRRPAAPPAGPCASVRLVAGSPTPRTTPAALRHGIRCDAESSTAISHTCAS